MLTAYVFQILLTLRQIFNEQKKQTVLLQGILNALQQPIAVKILFFVEGTQVTSMVITDSQKFTASIAPVDAKGNPAPVESGSIVWTGPAFVALTPSADGLSCDVAASGIGTGGTISVSADADLGTGVVTISGTLPIDVTAGQAVSLSISTTPPVEQ